MPSFSSQPRDIENQIISNAITAIPAIQNITVTSGGWTAVYTNVNTKNIILQSRSSSTWLFSTISGSPYLSVKNGGSIQARLVVASGTLIGYCSTTISSETIELCQGR